MAYDTNNPVGSTDPRDLYDNAGNLDKFVNGEQPFYPDRLGKQRISWSGIEADVESAFDGWEAQFQAFLQASSYEPPVSYAAGVTLERITQTVVRDDIQYRLKDPALLPYTITGNWATEEDKFVVVGDSSLRQDLMLGTSQIVSPESVSYSNNGSTGSLKVALDAIFKGDGLHPSMFGFSPGDDITTLLNSLQFPFDLQADSYIVTAGVTRTASLRNGTISYGGGTTTGAFANAIVAFTTTEDLDASRLHVKYTGSASSVIGICAYGGTHNINLRGCLAENTPGQGIRVQGCDDPDLTGCEALNCVRDSVGSTDLGLTYGAIAVFGESSVCNRAKLHNCNVSGTSTGISISYGSGHSVRDCVLKCTDKTASPEITMGIYCIGLLTDLEIYRNSIASYPLESIDIHNTGASPVAGVSGIRIHHNVVRDGGYLGVSVICAAPVLIRDVSIHDNILEINPAEAPDGFGGGIQCQQVRSLMLARNRCYCLTTPSVPLATFGIQINSCSHVSSESNYHQGAWGIYESYADWETLRVSGTDGDLLSAGSEGIRLTQTRASASGQLNGVRLVGTASGSKVVRQVGVPLTVFTMQNNYLNGSIDMAAGINDGLVSDNLFRNFSGSLVLGTATIAYNNPGWLDFVTASASPVPGTIKAWAPYRRGANTYYMPLYQPTTM
ncbi:right-handed parallel beta-helix repeat-containing protein [Pseudomonas palmensis]|uniref:right-handed parallel beta-helix repeat-containing protein n=1 Tax=Pseudomonas palmensis TaxID=2815362 RepID=UPI001AE47157|nr:right-handed parallel beta-helix repeat-containing protein [Pseudomonas palmensis]